MDVDRSKFIGGSDVAAILGISPWRTPVELWQDKITPRVENKKKVFTRGKRWESVVAEMLIADLESNGHTVEIITSNQRYIDQDHDFLACEIDFEIKLDGEDEITNVELKTVHPFKVKEWGESESDDMPIWYTAQVMHGLGVTRRKRGILAALFGADELRTYPVEFDLETSLGIREKCIGFWFNHVLTELAPDPIKIDDLSILYPTNDELKTLQADENLTSYILRLRAIELEIKAREAEYESIEFDVKRAMQDATHIILPNGKEGYEWKMRSGSYLDQERLKEEHPDIHKQFMKKWTSRVSKVKSFSREGL